MLAILTPHVLSGRVAAPSSKSQAHRLLICAALADTQTEILCPARSADIDATVDCLRALGAEIQYKNGSFWVMPMRAAWPGVVLPCRESGSTLRFLLPVLGALGVRAQIRMHGRLPERPLSPLWELLEAHGMQLRREDDLLHVCGQLQAGSYALPGNVSSQFVSGLLFALPLLAEDSVLTVTGQLQSARYVAMTEQALRAAGIHFEKNSQCWTIPGGQRYAAPGRQLVEGDWSNAAFFLCMGALSRQGVRVSGLDPASLQADRAITEILTRFGAEVNIEGDTVTVRRDTLRGITLDAGPVPDLVPVVSVLAALCAGETRIENAARLRIKESDRLRTTAALIEALGGTVRELPDGLVITGQPALAGGSVDASGDHRIAMSAAVAACGCTQPVTVCGSECVAKSYPAFWEDFTALQEEAL